MTSKGIALAVGAALMLTGASASGGLEPGQSSSTTSESALEPDLEALRASLRAVELAFADSLARQDRELFGGFLSDHAIFVSGQVLRGKQAILEGWSVFFDESAPSLVWKPETVEIQEGGRLGLTRGPFILRQTAPDGTVRSQSGIFTSIWERQTDDSWKIVFDIGCPPCGENTQTGE